MKKDEYLRNFQRRLIDFSGCLLNSADDRWTHDIRILCVPSPQRFTHGDITLLLLSCLRGGSVAEAHSFAEQIRYLLNCYLPELQFDIIPSCNIHKFLKPFHLGHIVSLSRRVGIEQLDTIRPGESKKIGFIIDSSKESPGPLGENAIVHIYPFLPVLSPINNLLKLLLRQTQPIMISCRFRPTRLEESEELFLEEQIARCESAIQVGLRSSGGSIAALKPTLQEQARLLRQHQEKLLYGLKDNSALLTFEIISSKNIPAILIDAIASWITEPAGGIPDSSEQNLWRYLAGGYEAHVLAGELAQRQKCAIETLEMTLVAPTYVPVGAGRIAHMFDSIEAGLVLPFPPACQDAPLGIQLKNWRSAPMPVAISSTGTLLGVNLYEDIQQEVRIAPEDRRRHVYAVGQTGTGKTAMLKTMILDDMRAGQGLCVIDPHGDLYRELLGRIPDNRLEDVALIDPTDTNYPVGLNLLECETEDQTHFVAQEFVGMIMRFMEDEFGASAVGSFAGPVFFQHVRMNLLLAMSNPDDPGTLLEFNNIFEKKNFWQRWLPLCNTDPVLEQWVEEIMPNVDYKKVGSEGIALGTWISSKFQEFIFDPYLRNIFGQKRARLNLRRIMDQRKILLVNLAKGELTEQNSRFLGMVLMAKLMTSSMGRVRMAERERPPFNIYVDEFQSLATQSFSTMLSESRKFGVNLVLANQFISQIKDSRIMDAIFGNVGTMICFRLGQADAERMEREFHPEISRSDLISLPNWRAYVSTLVHGQTMRPFDMHTIVDESPYDERRANQARSISRSLYAKDVASLHEEILRSFSPEPWKFAAEHAECAVEEDKEE